MRIHSVFVGLWSSYSGAPKGDVFKSEIVDLWEVALRDILCGKILLKFLNNYDPSLKSWNLRSIEKKLNFVEF